MNLSQRDGFKMTDNSVLLEKIRKNIIDVEIEDQVEALVAEAVDKKIDVVKIVDILTAGLDEVGTLYDKNEYFLSELLICGDRAKKGIEILKPLISQEQDRFLGKIIFGSVKGDIHDIGKTIISAFLIGAGFIVYDLGVEVTADKFIEAIRENDANILAMSTLLTSCLDEMKVVIDKIIAEKMRDKIKIIIGGRPVTRDFAEKIGADGFAFYPQDAVRTCKKFIEKE